MKKSLYLLCFIAALNFSCSNNDDNTVDNPVSSDCTYYDGWVTLETQAQVDAFGALNYCYIYGAGLTIGSANGPSDITNLDALNNLKGLDGKLTIINNPLLTSLEGLENIIKSDIIEVNNNDALTSLNGIGNVQTFVNINTGYYIYNNALITNLNGLQPLQAAPGIFVANCPLFSSFSGITATSVARIDVSLCPALQNFEGLSTVTSVGMLHVFDNPNITSFEGLENLQSIEILEIKNNPLLLSFTGLDNVTAITHDARIESNGLTSLTGLGSLSYVNELYLYNNALVSLEGINALTEVRDLTIYSNPNLVSLNGLNALTTAGNVSISSNAALTSISALSGLTTVHEYPNDLGVYTVINFEITYNNMLESLDGLQSFSSFTGNNINISNNSSLKNFCSLQNLLLQPNNVSNNIIFSSNFYSPSVQDVIAGNCSID